MLVGSLLALLAGCAVPQPRGDGRLDHLVEPTSRRGYYLYLPKEYVEASETERARRQWPLVVTFHGMKPYDIAYYQAREWQQEADRYGYVVIAPELRAFDFFFGEFPLRTLNNAFKSDVDSTVAIVDHVLQTTHADPNNVLSTSWSSGGYMAHYMLNQHPERFTCLAVRQSNFSADVLDSAKTDESIYHPVLVLSTQNDFGICKRETRKAIKWYEQHDYKNFAWVYINRLGHERTPDIAADFFARVAGVQPNRPPHVLVKRQAIDGNATGLALLAGNMKRLQRPEPARNSDSVRRRPTPERERESAPPVLVARSASRDDGRRTPPRNQRPTRQQRKASPLRIRVSSSVGFEPLLLVYSAECPNDWYKTADFHWTLNGQSIGQGVNGQRTIAVPDDYVLELLVVTQDGKEYRARHPIRVLQNVEASADSSS